MTDNLDPDLQAMARLAQANGHGPLGTPESQAYLAAVIRLQRLEACEHCKVVTAVLPLAHQRWGLEHLHETHCPRHDDNTKAITVDATPNHWRRSKP